MAHSRLHEGHTSKIIVAVIVGTPNGGWVDDQLPANTVRLAMYIGIIQINIPHLANLLLILSGGRFTNRCTMELPFS